ncbi:MAG: UDP-N-acetylmuramoyl-L-alanyl-D-glutamate--2,6-diaminopimelate ligase [Christensenellales bacterium]|jgi:UDP-N-acetylmuramoyl-L-alanyl-D-glutamate--2,6-diaminopimelate ligase
MTRSLSLRELFAGINHVHKGGDAIITSIECDSRQVGPGCLFVCVVGTFQDGHVYAEQAVRAGAAALLVERELPLVVPQIIVEDTRTVLALCAAKFYDYPAKRMRMVGVTGTNGKTTTTYMLKSVAEEAGIKVGLIGTITNLIGDKVLPAAHTTPDAAELHRLLRQMVDEGVDLCVMEVSSHSLDQKRVYGIEYDAAVFTNLTQDHLDYHKTFENYLQAKRILFTQAKHAVLNCDDEHWPRLMDGILCGKTTFGVRENADIYAKNIDITPAGVAFDMYLPAEEGKEARHIKLNISGLFSVFNAMGTAGAALVLGFTPDEIAAGLQKITSVSGRLEKLPVPNREYSVLLDYAHTPDALENVLKTVRGFTKNRLIVLFGCGGDRDRAKRPIMGEVAGRYADFCIITSDNPRSEDPQAIMRSIEEGVARSGCEYVMIESRYEAIKKSLEMGAPGDVIVLAGKGHETYQEINGIKNHFDEKEIVAEIAAQLADEH